MKAEVSAWEDILEIFLLDFRFTEACWWKSGFLVNFGLKIRLPLREVAPPAPERLAEDSWVGFLGIGVGWRN